jgi:antitoxin component of RelBE/YafQ-DinJ toxin-antitoxin module
MAKEYIRKLGRPYKLLQVRVEVDEFNAFKALCEEMGISVQEMLRRLLIRNGIIKDTNDKR